MPTNLLDDLRLDIASLLVGVEDVLAQYNLKNLNGITLVARDPADPLRQHVIVSSGGDDEVVATAELLESILVGADDQ